jgi:hypothetical protein
MMLDREFKDHDIFEICRLTDKVQLKTKSNPLTSEYIRKAIRLYDLAEPYGQRIYIEVWSGFSVARYAFKSHCTQLILKAGGGMVRRCIAPEREHGRGDPIHISVIKPTIGIAQFQTLFPGFLETGLGDQEHLIFAGA